MHIALSFFSLYSCDPAQLDFGLSNSASMEENLPNFEKSTAERKDKQDTLQQTNNHEPVTCKRCAAKIGPKAPGIEANVFPNPLRQPA